MFSFRRQSRFRFALVATLAACGGGGDGGTTPTPVAAGFTVALSSATLSIEQGASGAVTATIARTGSFAGTVNLSTESVPAGITASFNPSAVTAATTSTTLAVTVAASVAPGPYTFTIRGQAAGIADQKTATVSLTVTAKPAIAIALSATSATVQQGANATFSATLARTNFTGAVALAVTNASTGITPTVTNAGDVYTVTVAVSPVMPVAVYALTVTASGTGVTAVSATFTLTVTAAPPASITLAASPTALTMQAGSAAQSSTITITRINFTGTVVTAVQSGLPTGVTATINPSGPQAGSTVTVTFAASVSTTPGTYNVVLQGAGFGATAGTVAIALTITAPPANSISITALPTALIAVAGGAGATTTITITRNNFPGLVTIAPSGVPGGVGSATTPSATTGNSATITFTANAGTVPGTYPVTITGSGTGINNATVVVNLTVPPPSISLTATPAAITVQRGTVGNVTIGILRSNFGGAVALVASSLPNGVTGAINGSPTTASTLTLTLGVSASAATGTSQITITGSGIGLAVATTTVSLTVTQASSGGNVTWQFCALTGIPIWFAAQDGNTSAPFVQVAAGANNTYSFNITSQGAVAWVGQSGANNYSLSVVYGTRAELAAQVSGQCSSQTSKSLTGTVSGLTSATEFASVAFGYAFASPAPTAALPNFTINGAPDGVHDLMGTRSTFNVAMPAAGLLLNKIFIKRSLNPPNLGSVGTVDFNGGDAFDPGTKQLTINGAVAGEMVQASNTFITNTQSYASLGLGTLASGSTYNIFTVPSARTVAGDVNAISAIALLGLGTQNTSIRSVTSAFRDPSNQTLSLGPAPNTPTVSVVATSPYGRFRTQVTRQSEYNNYWTTVVSQNSGTLGRSAAITMQEGYIGSVTSFDVTLPDFTSVGGWQNIWGLQSLTATWNVATTGWISGNGGLSDGSVFRTAQRQGQLLFP